MHIDDNTVRTIAPKLRKFISRMANGSLGYVDADDLTQDTFVELLKHPNRIESYTEARFCRYGCLIARCQVAKRIRRRQVEIKSIGLCCSNSHAPDSDPAASMQHALSDLIPSLTDVQRTVLSLRLYGYTVKEIAKRVERSTTFVRRVFSKVRVILASNGSKPTR